VSFPFSCVFFFFFYRANIKGTIIIKAASLTGRNSFQAKYIKLSYRMRGSVARIQTNSVARSIVFTTRERSRRSRFLEKITTVINLIIKMFIYSAMKIRANDPALYSTLNPETSSDSPSAKSKGVRFVSARLVINHMKHMGIAISIIQDDKDIFIT